MEGRMKEGRSLDVVLEIGKGYFIPFSIHPCTFIEHLLCISHGIDNGTTEIGKIF